MRRARVHDSFWNGVGGAKTGSWGTLGTPLVSSMHSLHAVRPCALPDPHPLPSFSGQIEGRLGPSTVVLDHTGGFEGLLLVNDDLLGVSEEPQVPAPPNTAPSSS